MAKIPYIPLFIGDWEQDTNALSLQCEAAWLKIIFKMFKDDKSGLYKTSTKALQNLWKCDTKTVQDIIDELKDNDVCIIEFTDEKQGIVFKNRRMLKEKKISKARKEAVQNRYKSSTNTNTKTLQIAEYDIEYDNDTVLGDKEGAEGKGDQKPEIDTSQLIVPMMHNQWMKAFPKYPENVDKDWSSLREIADQICEYIKQAKDYGNGAVRAMISRYWQQMIDKIASDGFLSKYSLMQVSKHFQSIIQSMHAVETPKKSELQYLYERYCEGADIVKTIDPKHFQELLELKLITKPKQAVYDAARQKRITQLQQPMNEQERKLNKLYAAKDWQHDLVKEDFKIIERYVMRLTVTEYFKKQKDAKAVDVLKKAL